MRGEERRVAALLAKLEEKNIEKSAIKNLKNYKILCSTIKNCPENSKKDTNNKNKINSLSYCGHLVKLNSFIPTFVKNVPISLGIKTVKKGLLWSLLIFGILLVSLAYKYQIYTLSGFSRVWLYWENIDLHAEQCTIDMPSSAQDVFRPPVDCAMCRDVNKVEKVRNLSPKQFEERYAYSGKPVVVIDGQKNWSASNTFTFDFFRQIYSEDSPALSNFERNCQFFPYKTSFRNLREIFNMSEQRIHLQGEPWYIGWSNCDSAAGDILRHHYSRPYFLPELAESSKTDWIFMGTKGHGAHMHLDHVGNPSWQAQLSGVKRWYLEPPPECYFSCPSSMYVDVYPGEIIVLDTNIWIHGTDILSDDLSITIGSEYD